jgi:nitrite reductase/ring-hydroxylating ferredoxin subunit
MAGTPRVICAAAELAEGGRGVRFERVRGGVGEAAFAVRFDGAVRAFVNRCAHVAVELDWQPGNFFDADGLYLMCATHGALYDPVSGACAGGPCRGQGLTPVPVREEGGFILLDE